ncbi:MAG: 3-phosphoshikimate 1-carboxyvinyltransferase [Bacteroidota bacterium]
MKKLKIISNGLAKNDHQVYLPASKSESNRLLILEAISNKKSSIQNLSTARDTQIMKRLLSSESDLYDVKDAGTVMRFLTAFLAINTEKSVTITGTDRMQKRPIGILVDSLKALGADIEYLNESGYPPLKINPFKNQEKSQIEIKSDVSSQYISALMMIAPQLENGLEIKLIGKISSKPYILMTRNLMKLFGVKAEFKPEINLIKIESSSLKSCEYIVESDWSGASYWYEFLAISELNNLFLKGLRKHSFQGDSALVDIYAQLGIRSEFKAEGVFLVKDRSLLPETLDYDFSNCPDLAQAVCISCATLGVKVKFTGLESLKIKETDRINAIDQELKKIGSALLESDSVWEIVDRVEFNQQEAIEFQTYEDHRMAMCLAPLASKFAVIIEEPEVVNKSYPEYWDELEKAGLSIEEV